MDYEIDFSQDTFKEVNFKSAIFCLPTSFENAKFLQLANFDHAKFKSTVDFGSVQFDQNVYFEHADFGDHANFSMLNLEQKEKKLKSTILCFQPLNSTTLQLLIIANFMVKAVSMERCLTE